MVADVGEECRGDRTDKRRRTNEREMVELTGLSLGSMKKILMMISNSPQPVSVISYGGLVTTTQKPHNIQLSITHFILLVCAFIQRCIQKLHIESTLVMWVVNTNCSLTDHQNTLRTLSKDCPMICTTINP